VSDTWFGWEREEIHPEIWWGVLKRGYLEDREADGRITLK